MRYPYRRFILSLLTPTLILLVVHATSPIVEAWSVGDDARTHSTPLGNQPIALAFVDAAVAPESADSSRLVASGIASTSGPLLVVRVKKGGLSVRARPTLSSDVLTGLYYDSYLPVHGQLTDANGVLWYSVRLWGSLDGWLRADDTETGDSPLPSPTPVSAPSTAPTDGIQPPEVPPSAVITLVATGQVRDWFNLREGPSGDSPSVAVIAPGSTVQIKAYQSDSSGSVWYKSSVADSSGWIWGGGVDLSSSNALPRLSGDRRVVQVAGKGMWLPVPLVEMASPDAIVNAARALGLTHLYLEAGDSSRGFYGRAQAERLLPVAHRSGITVLAWILTSLDSVPVDLAVSQQVARFRAASGDGFDGIAPDVEFNMNGDDVRTYSEILRANLGESALIVGAIYPAGSWIGREHPIAAILSRSFDGLAPMVYWHDAQRSFDGPEIADLISTSVDDLHGAVGDTSYPVEVIGQAYDPFSRNGAGRFSPTGDEVAAAITSARDSGAFGVSLFQWGTMTPSEWDALANLTWPGR